MPPALEERLSALLDLDSLIDDDARHEELLALLREHLLPMMKAASTLNGLRSGEGQRFVKASLVEGDAQRLLAAWG